MVTCTSNNSDANQFNSSPIALYTKKYKVNSRPHGEGWGETWGKFAVPVGKHGGSLPSPWGNMREIHPRSAPCTRGAIKVPHAPRPRWGGGGGGGGGGIVVRCIIALTSQPGRGDRSAWEGGGI